MTPQEQRRQARRIYKLKLKLLRVPGHIRQMCVEVMLHGHDALVVEFMRAYLAKPRPEKFGELSERITAIYARLQDKR